MSDWNPVHPADLAAAELDAKLLSPEVVAQIGWAVRGWLPVETRELVARKAEQMRAAGVELPPEFPLTNVHLKGEAF